VSLPLYYGYNGTITAPTDGEYRISASTGDKQLVQLTVDDRSGFAGCCGLGEAQISMHLTKGPHKIAITPVLGPDPGPVRLGWATPAEQTALIAPAVAAAKKAGTAIVFAYDEESEGLDRPSLGLPDYQNDLISQVARANPNTIVVLNTGSSLTMPWLGKVKSVLDMWYPGQEGAAATTALLFGDVSPSGRLTQTFPADEAKTPVSGDPKRYPGVDGKVDYSEGIQVGYRWYDANKVTPLFPFGFGLGYTSFDYRQLAVTRTFNGLDVSMTVRNTGRRLGDAVPQVYLGPSPSVSQPQAVRGLVGYQKISLWPGESRRVHIQVTADQLKYWSTSKHNWLTGTGVREIFAGSSSADLPLQSTVDVRGQWTILMAK
jgi:beta-glucosidase